MLAIKVMDGDSMLHYSYLSNSPEGILRVLVKVLVNDPVIPLIVFKGI